MIGKGKIHVNKNKIIFFLYTSQHCTALRWHILNFPKPAELGNHLQKKVILHFTIKPIPAVQVRQNNKFAAFCCVFLILKAGVINSPINRSEKR